MGALMGGTIAYASQITGSTTMKQGAVDMRRQMEGKDIDADKVALLRRHAKKGMMNRQQFAKAMYELGIDDDEIIESYFECYDKNHDGTISFEEFAAGVAMVGMHREEVKDQLRFVFECCDILGNGVVSREELRRIIHALMITHERVVVKHGHDRSYFAASPIMDNVILDMDLGQHPDPHHNGWKSSDQLARLRVVHNEFPDLKDAPMEECLRSMSTELSNQIFDEVQWMQNKKKGQKQQNLTFDQFSQWAKAGSQDATFLLSLFEEFQKEQLVHFTETEAYLRDFDNVLLFDGSTLC